MQNRNYELIERARLSEVMKEQGLGLTGVVDQSDVAKVGKIAGLDYIVLGNILGASAVDKAGSNLINRAANMAVNKVVDRATDKLADNVIKDPRRGANNIVIRDTRGGSNYSSEVKVAVNLKVINVETGEIVFSDNAEDAETISWGESLGYVASENYFGAAQKAIAKAAHKIVREIAPLEPSVVLVKKNKGDTEVVIDMGRQDGIREGQHFLIVREGEPIYGRGGEIIGVDITEIAQITITLVEATTANAKVVEVKKQKSGKGTYEIIRGDLLRPQDRQESRTTRERLANWISK